MRKICVIGASGMLGYAVSEYFKRKGHDVREINRRVFDIIEDPINRIESVINNSETVINCAGVIKPRINDFSIEDVIRINSIFPRNLAKLCNKNNIKCFHITTDCVYSGKKGGYTEEDYCDADDLYGMTKNAGDTNECMTLRTSIIGEENSNERSLLEWVKSQAGKEINGFTNHRWNGVTTVYLAEIIDHILARGLYQKGIFHIYSPNIVNKYELMRIFGNIYELSLVVNPYEAEVSIDRSINSIYDLSKSVSVKPIALQVKEMKMFFNQKSSSDRVVV